MSNGDSARGTPSQPMGDVHSQVRVVLRAGTQVLPVRGVNDGLHGP